MLPKPCLGDIVTGYWDEMQPVSRGDVVAKHAVAWGRQKDGGIGIGQVEEERVEECSEAIGGEDVAGVEGNVGPEKVIEEAGCRCWQFWRALRVVVCEI